jgi:cysteinyl-tRNA synthetase
MMNLKIHDTLTGEKRAFEPLVPGQVSMYVCGVTPYARSHIGHARCYVAFDIIYRYLLASGYAVTYVRNFTDVDDKIINRANERGMAAVDLAQENIEAFYADMDALGIARPTLEPRVSTSIPRSSPHRDASSRRASPTRSTATSTTAVDKFEGYGKLGKRSFDEMQAGARVEVDAQEEHPMDFALWKAAKPGEPAGRAPGATADPAGTSSARR